MATNIFTDLKQLEYRSNQVERSIEVERKRAADEKERNIACAPKPIPKTPEQERLAQGGKPLMYRTLEQQQMADSEDRYRNDQFKRNCLHRWPTEEQKRTNRDEREMLKLYRQLVNEDVQAAED